VSLYERISSVVSFTLLGVVAYFLIQLPNRVIELTFVGTPLTLVVSQRWLMALLLGGLAGTGTSAVVREHPRFVERRLSGYLLAFMVLPTLLTILVVLVLPLFTPNLAWWVAGILASGLLLWFTVLAEYHIADPRDHWYELSHFWLNLVGFGVAFGFFVLIYGTRARSILSATGVSFIGGALAVSLLRAGPDQIGRTWLFAAITALAMGQSTWVLNYWRVSPLTAGFWLLLIFYVFIGLAQQQLLGRLTRRALIEFASVTLLGLLVIARFAP
jgi:hypothetical protein